MSEFFILFGLNSKWIGSRGTCNSLFPISVHAVAPTDRQCVQWKIAKQLKRETRCASRGRICIFMIRHSFRATCPREKISFDLLILATPSEAGECQLKVFISIARSHSLWPGRLTGDNDFLVGVALKANIIDDDHEERAPGRLAFFRSNKSTEPKRIGKISISRCLSSGMLFLFGTLQVPFTALNNASIID